MSDPNSNLSPPADQGVWQFSLRQCLVAVACVAVVFAIYRLSELLGWAIGVLLTVPLVIVTPIRGVKSGLLIGACVGAAAGAMGLATTVPWQVDGDFELAIDLSFELIILPVVISASIGATLGAATSLYRDHRDGGLVLVLLVIEIVAVMYLLLPKVY